MVMDVTIALSKGRWRRIPCAGLRYGLLEAIFLHYRARTDSSPGLASATFAPLAPFGPFVPVFDQIAGPALSFVLTFALFGQF